MFVADTNSCSSLVTVSYVPRWPSKIPTSILRLAHASVADYLTQPNPTGIARFHFSRTSARQFLARTCIGYFMNPEFSKGHTYGRHQKNLREHPFLRHCIDRWPEYLEKLPGEPDNYLDSKTRQTVQAFFDTSSLPNGGNYAFWVGCLIPDMPLDYVINTRPLYVCANTFYSSERSWRALSVWYFHALLTSLSTQHRSD